MKAKDAERLIEQMNATNGNVSNIFPVIKGVEKNVNTLYKVMNSNDKKLLKEITGLKEVFIESTQQLLDEMGKHDKKLAELTAENKVLENKLAELEGVKKEKEKLQKELDEAKTELEGYVVSEDLLSKFDQNLVVNEEDYQVEELSPEEGL